MPIKARWRHDSLALHSAILAEAMTIASISLQRRGSISLAPFLQCPHFRSSCSKLFFKNSCLRLATLSKKKLWHRCFPVNFCKIFKNTFFHRTLPVPVSGICMWYIGSWGVNSLVSFYSGESWNERLHFYINFPQNNHFLHWNINMT